MANHEPSKEPVATTAPAATQAVTEKERPLPPLPTSSAAPPVSALPPASAGTATLVEPDTDTITETETEAEQTNHDEEMPMKLVVRSQYWGRVLKGRLRRNFDYPSKPYRVIACQAVVSNEGPYWGCCPHHGKRVLELKEHHFEDHHTEDWDLYMVGTTVGPNYIVHSFFLLPNAQDLIDINRQTCCNGWNFIGTVPATEARLGLGRLLSDFLQPNDELGFRYHHVHLEILMDQVFDRETPRTRKAANEKNRAERGYVHKSKPNTNHQGPPIHHVPSNDTSCATENTMASTVTNESSFHGPSYLEQPVHFYPASVPQTMGPMMGAPIPAPMPYVNPSQVLHGFPMTPNMPPMPSGYVPYGFGDVAGTANPGHPEWMIPHPERCIGYPEGLP